MHVFKATGLCYRINSASGGKGVYVLSGVKETLQELEINTTVWVFQLLLAGIVLGSGDSLTVLLCILASSIMVVLVLNK